MRGSAPREGRNDFGTSGYRGPCPPPGHRRHHYVFRLFAHGHAGRALEDRNRQQLYEIAKTKNIPGRSKMGKWELIKAIRNAG